MSVGVVIIAHDKIGTAIRDTAIAMVEHCPVEIYSLEHYREHDPDEFLQQAQNTVRQADQGQGVLVLTDMYGATPSNICSRLDSDNIIVLAGLNLPMLVRAINYHTLDLPSMADKVLDGGISSIIKCEQ